MSKDEEKEEKIKVKVDITLKFLKPEPKEYYRLIEGCRGLRFFVYPTGRKCFIYRYKIQGKLKQYTIGEYLEPLLDEDGNKIGELTLANAKKEHSRLVKMRKAGKDPQLERLKEKNKTETNPTLEKFSLDHINDKELAPDTVRLYTGLLNKNIFPVLGSIQIKDITTPMIISQLKKIRKKKPASASKILGILKEIFREAKINKLIDSNPVIELTRKDHAGGADKTRKRFLTFDEIKLFLTELETAPASIQTKYALKVALLTGKRISEVLTVERHEVDFIKRVWTIPWHKRKQTAYVRDNKEPDHIYITDTLMEIFKDLSELHESSYLFAHSVTCFKKPITRHSVKDFLGNWSETLGIEKFSPHDLRRTFASNAHKTGISYEGREACLAHSKKGLDRNYDQDDYWDEKIKSWQLWESKIISIMNREKVISLDERRA